ncbi:hypothetical protein FKM82_022581 [Ascaphus truei]
MQHYIEGWKHFGPDNCDFVGASECFAACFCCYSADTVVGSADQSLDAACDFPDFDNPAADNFVVGCYPEKGPNIPVSSVPVSRS